MTLDSGGSIIKAKTVNREFVFPHAIQPITEGEYPKITSWSMINIVTRLISRVLISVIYIRSFTFFLIFIADSGIFELDIVVFGK
jgi:hypothetical protein